MIDLVQLQHDVEERLADIPLFDGCNVTVTEDEMGITVYAYLPNGRVCGVMMSKLAMEMANYDVASYFVELFETEFEADDDEWRPH